MKLRTDNQRRAVIAIILVASGLLGGAMMSQVRPGKLFENPRGILYLLLGINGLFISGLTARAALHRLVPRHANADSWRRRAYAILVVAGIGGVAAMWSLWSAWNRLNAVPMGSAGFFVLNAFQVAFAVWLLNQVRASKLKNH